VGGGAGVGGATVGSVIPVGGAGVAVGLAIDAWVDGSQAIATSIMKGSRLNRMRMVGFLLPMIETLSVSRKL
jgi:hypothetical protein